MRKPAGRRRSKSGCRGLHQPGTASRIVGHPHNGAQVAADAVIGGVVDQNRHRVGVLGNGFGHLFPLHAQADAEPLVHFGVDIHRHSAAEHQCVQHAAVHVAGQDDLIPALAGGQHHALHRAGGAAHHQKRVGSAERIGGQFLRFADNGYRMAEIIQRLHAVHIHPNALLAQKGGQFRVAASPLMTGHIKGNHAHLAEIFQRFVDGGRGAGPTGRVFSHRSCLPPFAVPLGSAVWQNKKRKPYTGVQTCV